MSETTNVAVTSGGEGRVATVRLVGEKGHIITRAAIAELGAAFARLAEDKAVHAVVLCAEGRDFSFGASVPEHAPGEVERMLPELSKLVRAMVATSLPICAAVQGRCLGGALEIVLPAHRIVVSDDAKLGLPEVTLGVFPPVGAALLPLRLRPPDVDRIVTLGELVSGEQAVAIGLADELAKAGELEARALAWAGRYAKLSRAAVTFATRAARASWSEALGSRLDELERLYLRELMATHDAKEGIAAFLERRPPVWNHA